MSAKVAAVVVSHNSESTLERCLQCLTARGAGVGEVIVVDSGSTETQYVRDLQQHYPFQLQLTDNIGFAKANNLGFDAIEVGTSFVLFVNPDLFLPADFVSKALNIYENAPDVGILSGKLLGYDLHHDMPTGKIDSTGILRKWYGRWYDRGQGDTDVYQYETPESMIALCGALLCCRMTALRSLKGPVFDPDFFLYKEDIELSLRMRKAGWKLLYHPELHAYHCRGWQNERSTIPYTLKRRASQSEILLYKKHPSPYMLWALLKYILVVLFRL